MAVRVTAEEVKEIIQTTMGDVEIEAFITAANLTVTAMVGSNANLSDNQLAEIEKWFSAHLIASTRERQAQSESAGGASISYGGQTGLGLDFTSYGQMVKILDVTGTMASQIGKKTASLYAVKSFASTSSNVATDDL